MSRTSNITARVEPLVKQQAEQVLNQLGIPMSNAIDIFLRQVVLHRGIPFDMKLPARRPLSLTSLSEEAFHAELEKGFADMAAGRVRKAEDVFVDLQKDYGV